MTLEKFVVTDDQIQAVYDVSRELPFDPDDGDIDMSQLYLDRIAALRQHQLRDELRDPDEVERQVIAIIKGLAYRRESPSTLPADSFIAMAARKIIELVIAGRS